MDRLTLAQMLAANPRRPGENPFMYQQRVGQAQWDQPAAPVSIGPVSPFPAPVQGVMAAGSALGQVPQLLQRAAVGQDANEPNGIAGPGQQIAKALLWAGNKVTGGDDANMLRGIGNIFTGAMDTPAAAQARAAAAPKAAAPAQAAAPQTNPLDAMTNLARALGGTVTSTLRSPAHNKAVGGVPNSFHMTGQAFDSVPPKGMNMGGWANALRSRLPGMDVINEGDHVHVEPGGGATPGQRMMGSVNDMGGLTNPFDPKYGQAAMGMLNQAKNAALQPQSASMDMSGKPEMPTMQQAPLTDFSKADAAFAQAKPTAMTEQEQYRTRVNGWFSGLGQSLASLPDGAGLGRVLAAVGGGAMAGAARGDSEVLAREEKLKDQLVQYNLASANREGTKAQVLQDEMQHNVETMNRAALTKWQSDSDFFFKTNGVSVQGDAFISSKMGKDGKMVITRTPIKGAVEAAFATRQAGVLEGMSGQFNSGNAMVAQARNSLVINAAAQSAAMAGNPQDAAAGAVLGTATLASDIVATGRAEAVIGDAEANKMLQKEVQQTLIGMGVMPGGSGYADAYQRVMAERITSAMLTNPGFRKRAMEYGGAASAAMGSQRAQDAKTTVTRGPRGTTVRTEQ